MRGFSMGLHQVLETRVLHAMVLTWLVLRFACSTHEKSFQAEDLRVYVLGNRKKGCTEDKTV
jgi:hypothetical protein